MDGEPPAKRARRTDSAAMWDKSNADGTASPRSAPTTDRDSRVKREHEGSRVGARETRRDDDRRRRSRSPRDKRDINRRSRSPRDRDRGYRDRDRDRGTAYDKDRDGHRDRSRSRSRSRDRYRSNRDQKPPRKRSRSPVRDGTSSTQSTRPRSPASSARPRPKVEDRDIKPPLRDIKPHQQTNGSNPSTKPSIEQGMDVDDETDDLEVAMKRTMGFSTFKSTHNTKVPGNQIYGVRKEKKTEYRQYMNRVGGFNRPLSPGK